MKPLEPSGLFSHPKELTSNIEINLRLLHLQNRLKKKKKKNRLRLMSYWSD